MGAVAPDSRPASLARLFAMAYRYLIDELHQRLRARGWTDVRPAYGFALLAARDKPITTTALAMLMGMTKQAASKLAATMVTAGYLTEARATEDGRVRPLRLTRRGARLLAAVEEIYGELETEWATVIGVPALERLRTDLTRAIRASHDGQLPAVRPVW
jgi:DNA-binding MarR family transcriptional regulator